MSCKDRLVKCGTLRRQSVSSLRLRCLDSLNERVTFRASQAKRLGIGGVEPALPARCQSLPNPFYAADCRCAAGRGYRVAAAYHHAGRPAHYFGRDVSWALHPRCLLGNHARRGLRIGD